MQTHMNNGIVALRRNVIYRDWRNGIDKYRFAGLNPEEVYMNYDTLNVLLNYMVKKYISSISVINRYNDVYDGRGTRITCFYDSQYTCIEGIKIIIDNSMKNETMRVVW